MSQVAIIPESGAAAEKARSRPRVAFVFPQCTHYTQGLFEILATKYDADFFFFSDGKDWYWERRNGSRGGHFRHEYLSGFRIGNARIAPMLPHRLLRARYDAIVAAVDGRFSLPVAIACARGRGIPFVLWTGIWHRIGTAVHRVTLPITRFVYRNADAVLAYGNHVKRYLESEGVNCDRIFVATHAVDNVVNSRPVPVSEISRLRNRLKVSGSSAILLFVGRLEPVKGTTYLLEAMQKVEQRELVLVIVGDGSERDILRWKAKQLGLEETVRFVGYVPPSETAAYYAAACALVVPSVTTKREKEQWGLVVNEGMNQGLPVIASDAVGAAASGLVRDGVNGFVVPERDSAALANAIERLCGDPELKRRMSEAARSTIHGWDHERMAADFEACLTYVLSEKKAIKVSKKPDSTGLRVGGSS